MSVVVQLLTIFFSFIYGFLYFVIFNRFKKYLVYGKTLNKFIYNGIYMSFSVFIYFISIVIINNGIIHFYFLLCFLLGLLVGYYFLRYIRRKLL